MPDFSKPNLERPIGKAETKRRAIGRDEFDRSVAFARLSDARALGYEGPADEKSVEEYLSLRTRYRTRGETGASAELPPPIPAPMATNKAPTCQFSAPIRGALPPIVDLKSTLVQDHLADLAAEAFGEINERRSSKAEFRYGKKGSVVVQLNGVWYDHEAKEGGGILELFARTRGIDPLNDKKTLIREAREYIGDPRSSAAPSRAPAPSKPPTADRSCSDRIKFANEIYARSIPIEGTVAEIYLRSRCITKWPPSLRFDPVTHALVAPITTYGDDARIFGVHQIRLDEQGRQKDFIDIGAPKKTRGVRSKRVVRLPGTGGGIIYIAEGLETALSIWLALGGTVEVVATLGTASNIRLPKGRTLIICRDDDPDNAGSHKAAAALDRHLTKHGNQVTHIFPFVPRRRNKNDFNDLHQQDGLRAVADRLAIGTRMIRAQDNIPLTDAPAAIPPEAIRAAINWIPNSPGRTAPLHIAKLTVGSGKTYAQLMAVREILAASKDKFVLICAPEHRLSDQIAADAKKETGHQAVVWRGREALQSGSATKTMCADLETIKDASRLLADLDEDVCKSCAHAAGCAFLAQKATLKAMAPPPRILIVSHQALRSGKLPAPYKAENCAAIFVDESPLQSVHRASLIPVSLLSLSTAELKLEEDDKMLLSESRGEIRSMIESFAPAEIGRCVHIDLAPGDFPTDVASTAKRLEYARKLGKKDERDWRDRNQNASISPLVRLCSAFQTITQVDDTLGWLHGTRTVSVFRREDGSLAVEVADARLDEDFEQIPIFVADALAEISEIETAVSRPATSVVEAQIAAPNQKVFQETCRTYSKRWLSNPKNRAAILSFIYRRAGSRTLVVTNKNVVDQIRDHLPEGCVCAHFNSVAGKNEWEEFDTIIVIGRASPSPSQIAPLARAFGAPVFDVAGPWQKGERNRRIIIDGVAYETPVLADQAADPTLEAFRRMIVDGQVEQAVGRLRGIRRDEKHPCRVFVLGDTFLSFPAERLNPGEIVDHDFSKRYATVGYCINDAAAEARVAGESERTVRKRRFEQSGIKWTPQHGVAFRFQIAGQGRKLVAGFYDPAKFTPDTLRTKIEQKLGPLALFEAESADSDKQLAARPLDEYESAQDLHTRLVIEPAEFDDEAEQYMRAMGLRRREEPDLPDA